MKKFSWKKALLMSTSLVLTAVLAIGGTLAYLQSEDSDVNVMTLGNVEIEQIEQERDANGELVDFTQGKPAYPAVGPIEWATEGVKVNGTEYKVFTDELKNVVDKIVTVNNVGKSDAYVRTLVAIEAPDYDENDLIHINWNSTDVTMSAPVKVEMDGVQYVVFAFTYKEALASGAMSAPSLMQLFLDSKADNAFCEKFGSSWDVMVLSQAIQTEGFADAATALNTGFGDVTEENVIEWFGGVKKTTFIVSNQDEMRAAMKTPGAKIILAEDVVIDDDKGTGYALYAKYDCQIDLNGHTIEVNLPGKDFYGVIFAVNGAKVDIVGDGNVEVNGGIGQWVWCTGANGATEINIYGGNWTNTSEDFSSDYCEGLYANREGKVNIYGGTFEWSEDFTKYTANESREGVITVYGGTFINFNPSVSHDSDGSYVAEGYTAVSDTQDNGDIWYTVVKKQNADTVDALGKGGHMTLSGSVSDKNAELNITAGTIIDLNSNELTVSSLEATADMKIADGTIVADYVESQGKATFNDVIINAGTPNDYSNIARGEAAVTVYTDVDIVSGGGGFAAAGGAKVEFNSGSVAVNSTSTSGRYVFYAEGEGSEITINGGTFSFSKTLNQKRAYIYAGAGTTVYVTGGIFGPASTRSGYTAGILGSGNVIITGGTFGFDPSAWVADGYVATQNDTTWTVEAKA